MRARTAWMLTCLALLACDPPVRPMPPDTGLDAPVDAPPVIDVGACVEVAGYYVGTSTCPALGGGFGACVSRDECDGALFLSTSAEGAAFTLTDERGTFSGGPAVLAPEVTCTTVVADGARLTLQCADRLGIGCTVTLQRRDSMLSGLCCVDDAVCEMGEACTLTALAGGPPITTACVERAPAPVAEREACTRSAPGNDDCAPGLYCAPVGATGMDLRCRALCRSAATCDPTEVCIATGSVPSQGFCAPGCDVFLSTCAAGLSCQPSSVYSAVGVTELAGACASVGTAAEGELCELTGCIGGLLCARDRGLELRCAPPCDDTHPCASGTCVPLADGSVLGACQAP